MMSSVSKRKRDEARSRGTHLGNHDEFLRRVTKSLYYGRLPSLPCLSLPVTELATDIFSQAQKGRSLKRLHIDDAAEITRNACVSPCSLVLALLYLERLKTYNSDYLAKIAPSELFLISLMVSNKFLQDDGEEDEVFADEWAASGDMDIATLKNLEWAFLEAIDWRLFVSDEEFQNRLAWLEYQIALQQGLRRGWFTYSDLSTTLNHVHIKDVITSLATVCIALSLSYLASVSTLLTSSLVVYNAWIPLVNQKDVCMSLTTCNSNVSATNEVILSTYDVLSEIKKEPDVEIANGSEFGFHTDSFKCCNKWDKYISYQAQMQINSNLLISTNEPKLGNWIWWHSSLYHWLYQSSLIAPMDKISDGLSFMY